MFKPVIKSNGSSHNSALLEAYFKSQAGPQIPSTGLSPLPSVKRDRPTEVIKPGIEMGEFELQNINLLICCLLFY